jgi:hypothetical protein
MEHTYSVKLKGIDLLSHSVEAPQEIGVDAEQTIFNFSVEERANFELKTFLTGLKVEINSKDNSDKLASFFVLLSFDVENFDSIIKQENGKLLIPKPLSLLTAQISLSTMRGIIYVYLKGTHLNDVLMPIIDPTIFFTEKAEKERSI